MVGCRRPFQQSSLFTPFPWCPRWWGRRRTTKKPGQGDASLLVLELFLRRFGLEILMRILAPLPPTTSSCEGYSVPRAPLPSASAGERK